jgi:hypothetical protein
MSVILKIRRGTTVQWASSTKVLQVGELGIDTTLNKIKAGNGSSLWTDLPFIESSFNSEGFVTDSELTTAIQSANEYTDTAVSGLQNSLDGEYVPVGDIGVADGVASLDENGKIPDSEIPDGIARDSEIITSYNELDGLPTLFSGSYTDLTDKPTIPSLDGYATETYVGTAISNLVDTAPETLNTLNELAAALGDDPNFATTISTSLGNKLDSSTASSTYAPIANPTFTGTVGGITKSMVGLANVDNTTDANKPVSTATQTALNLKLNLSDPSVDYYITNSGSGSYIVNGVSNGTIYFEKGKKYRIHINASGHPFWIQTSSGAYNSGSVYSTGITNNGASVGHIIVELPSNAPQLYYACQFHSSMAGSIITGTTFATYKALSDLSNVDNTSDANKPISTATQTSLDLKLSLTDPAIDYYITNSGSGSYTVNGVANGPVEFIKGKKYRIHINASGHPFWIQTVSGGYSAGNVYSTGITGNGTQAGHIIVELPQNAPDNLYYACQFHSSMAGAVLVRTDNVSFNAQSSSYTLTTSDSARLVEMSSGGTLTITDSSSFPVGFTCDVLQTGSSQVTIAGNGFTPNATPGLKLRAQWSSATLIKRALNSWVVLGDLSA